jgi:hypothetical protein
VVFINNKNLTQAPCYSFCRVALDSGTVSNIVRQKEEKAVIRVFLLRLALSLFPRSFLRAPALASVKA